MAKEDLKQLQIASDARDYLMNGIISFAEQHAQVDSRSMQNLLTLPKDISCEIYYPRGLDAPLPVRAFVQSVYGRIVHVRSLSLNSIVPGMNKETGGVSRKNTVEIMVESPSETGGTLNGDILSRKLERFLSPTLRIDIDNIPFKYALREQSVKESIKEEFDDIRALTGNVSPRCIRSLGDMLRASKTRKLSVLERFFTELTGPARHPIHRLTISDSD